MKIPVIDKNKIPLMPCSQRRAKKLIKTKQAKPYFQNGFFCIMLLREPSERNYQQIMIGIDTGATREGYTVATEKEVILNITSNTPYWVKDNVETRRMLRRSRRSRKTPYRKCRPNRSSLRSSERIPPSTLARWNAKLRILNQLKKIIPITKINIEDIKAKTIEGEDNKKNLSFSPLEVGKNYFYKKLEDLGYEVQLTQGYETKKHRDSRGFRKLTGEKKKKYVWESHNVDSHSLVEIGFGTKIKPEYSLYKLEFIEYRRRSLHLQNANKGNVRRRHGGTVSLGISRGSFVRWSRKGEKDILGYVGGNMGGLLSISNLSGKRITQSADKDGILVYNHNRIRLNMVGVVSKSILVSKSIPPTTKVVGLLDGKK